MPFYEEILLLFLQQTLIILVRILFNMNTCSFQSVCDITVYYWHIYNYLSHTCYEVMAGVGQLCLLRNTLWNKYLWIVDNQDFSFSSILCLFVIKWTNQECNIDYTIELYHKTNHKKKYLYIYIHVTARISSKYLSISQVWC